MALRSIKTFLMSSSFAIPQRSREGIRHKKKAASLSRRFFSSRRKVNPTCKEGNSEREDFQLKVKRFFMIIKYFFSPLSCSARLFIPRAVESSPSADHHLSISSLSLVEVRSTDTKAEIENIKSRKSPAAQLNSNQVKMF
jgi:hypothetical protein